MQITIASIEPVVHAANDLAVKIGLPGSTSAQLIAVDERWQQESAHICQRVPMRADAAKRTHVASAKKSDAADLADPQTTTQDTQTKGILQGTDPSLTQSAPVQALVTQGLTPTPSSSLSPVAEQSPAAVQGISAPKTSSKASTSTRATAKQSPQSEVTEHSAPLTQTAKEDRTSEPVPDKTSPITAVANTATLKAVAHVEAHTVEVGVTLTPTSPVVLPHAPATERIATPGASLDGPTQAAAAVPLASSVDDQVVLRATPGALEVGVGTGTHGWLRVRASLANDGSVSAQLVTTSTSSAERLHKDLPALSSYLAQEQIGIASVAVQAVTPSAAPQESTAGDAALFSTAGQQSRSGAGTQQDRSENAAALAAPDNLPRTPDELAAATLSSAAGYPSAASSAGGWLSVLA